MLHELDPRAGLVAAIERYDIGVEVTKPLDPQHTGAGIGKAHRNFVFVIKGLLEVLNIKNQPLIGPFSRTFLFDRLFCDGGRQRFLFRRGGTIGGSVDRAAAGYRAHLGDLGRGFDLVAHVDLFVCHSHAPSSRRLRVTRS